MASPKSNHDSIRHGIIMGERNGGQDGREE
jgi:hypothetical protein